MSIKHLFIFPIFILFYSCNQQNKEGNEQIEKQQFLEERNLVDVLTISNGTFTKEIVSNGKLKSTQKSDLQFKTAETIVEILVSNGSWVKAGQVIARIDKEDLEQQYKQALINLEKSDLELQDFFLSHAQLLADTTSEEGKNKFRIAEIRSGYAEAKVSLEIAKRNLRSTELKSPFNGKVVNLDRKVYEQSKPGEVFCTIIDDSRFEVEFKVIESEITSIELGKKVNVEVHANNVSLGGKITEINPIVDENGLITAKATTSNPGNLYDGMNVRVLIENEVTNQLIVPKTAVVLRQNQEVLFTYKSGIAFWTYVQTQYENSDSYAVIAHPEKNGSLNSGDTVIVNGNLNLAHESMVEIDEFRE